MATLGDLKMRIREETDRDEIAAGGTLEQRLDHAIERAVEYYSNEAFWFTRDVRSSSVVTTAGRSFVTMPAAVRLIDAISCEGEPLLKMAAESIEQGSETGQPSRWTQAGDAILLWPTPDAAYRLLVSGQAQVDAPEHDGDESVWTNEAQDLIAARAKFILFRDIFRDVEGTQLAAQAEGEALSRLRKESRRRMGAGLQARGDEPWTAPTTFNVNRGY
jgi:hypothetical protein